MLTDMDQPLGHAVGNALEVREAAATLRGEGPPDLTELALDACGASARALRSRRRPDGGDGAVTEAAVADGSAYAMYERWMRAQGGDPDVVGAARRRPSSARCSRRAPAYVHALGALAVGQAALQLGAGRREKDDPIDHAVGVVCVKKRGDAVEAGEPLAEIHAQDEAAADDAAEDVLAAYELADEPPRARSIVLETIG